MPTLPPPILHGDQKALIYERYNQLLRYVAETQVYPDNRTTFVRRTPSGIVICARIPGSAPLFAGDGASELDGSGEVGGRYFRVAAEWRDEEDDGTEEEEENEADGESGGEEAGEGADEEDEEADGENGGEEDEEEEEAGGSWVVTVSDGADPESGVCGFADVGAVRLSAPRTEFPLAVPEDPLAVQYVWLTLTDAAGELSVSIHLGDAFPLPGTSPEAEEEPDVAGNAPRPINSYTHVLLGRVFWDDEQEVYFCSQEHCGPIRIERHVYDGPFAATLLDTEHVKVAGGLALLNDTIAAVDPAELELKTGTICVCASLSAASGWSAPRLEYAEPSGTAWPVAEISQDGEAWRIRQFYSAMAILLETWVCPLTEVGNG